MKFVCIWLVVSIGLLIGLGSPGSLLQWLNDAHQQRFSAWPEAAPLSALTLTYPGGALVFMKHRRDRF